MNDLEIIQLCCSFQIPAADSRWTLLQEKEDMNEKLCSFVAALPRWRGQGDLDAFESLLRHSAPSSVF